MDTGRAPWLPFWLPEGNFGRDFGKENALTRKFVRPSGFEPETCGVGFRCSHGFAGVRKCALTLDLASARVRRRPHGVAPHLAPQKLKVALSESYEKH